jgi:acetyltransferase-like isoleucine patch superfamily enzyme
MIGAGSALHCADHLELGARCVVADRVTVVDSTHVRTPLAVNLLHHVDAKPTTIGEGVWLGASTVVAAGVTIGAGAFIGGGSVVTRDVPAWHLAAGNPARVLRELDRA